ncbi:substrate-binding domain-containing protein [Limibaculum sp. FT325]|uniref:substrate-binding domain-containing protein n=1 Tax=Thermohalobaculum sediminis TaxID=2939436 RepID=UPI0020C0D801|nr:substrate-binding domain-containing protein [Limibaculum sediminis]MCL5778221.1 substrate-binding domain-containing protein [Limibaculum sediminis]
MTKFSIGMAATAIATLAMAGSAAARDQIRIVGSSTVFPYTQAVSEEFANKTGQASPVVESTGTGGGMKIFCGGIGEGHPDITGASRAMKASEFKLCAENGVDSITEVLIGFDGLSVAHASSAPEIDVTKAQLFLALAAEVPVEGKIVPNPYTKWSEIDPALPDAKIQVFGPPPTSGTRDAFVELVMEEGCATFEAVEALEKDAKKSVCQRMRQDGPFIEAGENDNLIVQRLQADPSALGIFGYSFLFENSDTLKAVAIEGVAPNEDTIASGEYGISRPLFFYVKNAHRGVIAGLDEFITEYVSEAAMGPGGYLSDRGLIPLGDERRKAVQDAALAGKKMDAPGA